MFSRGPTAAKYESNLSANSARFRLSLMSNFTPRLCKFNMCSFTRWDFARSIELAFRELESIHRFWSLSSTSAKPGKVVWRTQCSKILLLCLDVHVKHHAGYLKCIVWESLPWLTLKCIDFGPKPCNAQSKGNEEGCVLVLRGYTFLVVVQGL